MFQFEVYLWFLKYISYIQLLQVSEDPISSHIWVTSSLDNIQTALKPLKNQKKLKQNFMTIFRLAESFKMMNRADPTITFFDGLFFRK